ncbi:MAG TPA: non-homologous end-joining DNA ligase [Gemmatimonadales bacterium]|nr:non-homologous end-joining DNA ligase [Gemmatimonadales bacterium]
MAGNVKVRVTHPERVLFPADGITKGNVVSYYLAVAPAMVPHLRDRPANLQRFPGGIDEPGFFQQARPDYFPSWVPGAVVKKEGGRIEHPLIQTAAALAYVANQGCITPHVWLSRVDRIDRPDQLIFDLDPSEKTLARVGEAARRVRELLAELGLTAFLKTTGSRGYHVTVPLDRRADFEAAREFAQAVAALLVRRHPALLTVEPRKADRGERIYIDTLRNAYGQTAVPPYAIRARPGAPVATPIAWDELGARGMRADRFTIRDVPSRLAAGIDPWRGWRRAARGVAGAARRLAAL